MTGTSKQQPEPGDSYKGNAIKVKVHSGATDQEYAAAVAVALTRPETNSAAVIENWQKDTHEVNALAAELRAQIEAVNGGDLQRAEGMLISQAHALENIFAHLARKATDVKYLDQWEVYMRMAMKAQNQCRMTLESLAAIKNPPVVYARQANINNGGNQQVNNGAPPPHTSEAQKPEIKQLEASHGERLDFGASRTAGAAHSQVETVGTVDRTEDGEREGRGGAQRLARGQGASDA